MGVLLVVLLWAPLEARLQQGSRLVLAAANAWAGAACTLLSITGAGQQVGSKQRTACVVVSGYSYCQPLANVALNEAAETRTTPLRRRLCGEEPRLTHPNHKRSNSITMYIGAAAPDAHAQGIAFRALNSPSWRYLLFTHVYQNPV